MIKKCQDCGEPRYQDGAGRHVETRRMVCGQYRERVQLSGIASREVQPEYDEEEG